MKLCIDCKHCEMYEKDLAASRCNAAVDRADPDPVTGEKKPNIKFCTSLRHLPDQKFLWKKIPPKDQCGLEGHWFEPKEQS